MYEQDVPQAVTTFSAVLVEDDRPLAELLTEYAASHGITMLHAATAGDGLRLIVEHSPDVVLLDVMLPDFSGVELCRRVRQRSDVPIVMLTARDGELDRISGLDNGADDYLVKPFSSPELLARLRAQVRRFRGLLKPPSGTLAVGPLSVDIESRTVTWQASRVELTTAEFDLLVALASRPGRVLRREQLLELIRGTSEEVFDRAIDFHIANLRHKLSDDPRSPRLIRTVRGVGYALQWAAL